MGQVGAFRPSNPFVKPENGARAKKGNKTSPSLYLNEKLAFPLVALRRVPPSRAHWDKKCRRMLSSVKPLTSSDYLEGYRAFLEKRRPKFEGR
jgi:hypothetical protein